uniref:Uncharacterized protein n=1 Tax=Anopheles culicifacies TaxID=139723 RepID=A0A182LXD5_9DIPT
SNQSNRSQSEQPESIGVLRSGWNSDVGSRVLLEAESVFKTWSRSGFVNPAQKPSRKKGRLSPILDRKDNYKKLGKREAACEQRSQQRECRRLTATANRQVLLDVHHKQAQLFRRKDVTFLAVFQHGNDRPKAGPHHAKVGIVYVERYRVVAVQYGEDCLHDRVYRFRLLETLQRPLRTPQRTEAIDRVANNLRVFRIERLYQGRNDRID